jgi:hypothetical protein
MLKEDAIHSNIKIRRLVKCLLTFIKSLIEPVNYCSSTAFFLSMTGVGGTDILKL